MTRQHDSADLGDLRPDADSVVRAFLAIRPSGGRVWVDDAGNAVTSQSGDLLYLGNIFPSAASGGLPVGQPVPGFAGRKYGVRPTGIVDRATGERLSTYRSADVVDRLIDNLLKIRPDGGTYRVNERGDAATWVDGKWVYAGRVALRDWFPEERRREIAS